MLDELRQARQIVLFGGTAWLIDKYLPWLQGAGVEEKVLYVCDNDVVKHGSVINGYLIHPTNKILEAPDATIWILAGHTSAIYRSIRNKGIKNRIICAPHFRHNFAEPRDVHGALRGRQFVRENRLRLWSIYNQNNLYAERALEEIMRQRLLDLDAFVEPESILEFDTEENYFVDRSLAPLADITFIDCGAYNGDSTSAIRGQFGKQLKKVIAFEPFPNSCRQLSLILSTPVYGSVECVTINCGVGSKSAKAFIEINLDTEANALKERGEGVPVDVRIIDSFNFDILGDAVLKLDVEGSELEALKGAKGFIQNHNPYIAICVYHKMGDILQLPKFIIQLIKITLSFCAVVGIQFVMQYQCGVLVQLLSGHLLSEFIFGPSLREHVTLFVRYPFNSCFKKGCTNSLKLLVMDRTAKEDIKRGTALVWRLVS